MLAGPSLFRFWTKEQRDARKRSVHFKVEARDDVNRFCGCLHRLAISMTADRGKTQDKNDCGKFHLRSFSLWLSDERSVKP